MKIQHRLLFLVLALTVLGAGIRLWQQQELLTQEREQVRNLTTEANRRAKERAAFEEKLRVAQDKAAALQTEVANVRELVAQAAANAAPAAKNSAGDAPESSAENTAQLQQWLADADDPAVLRRMNLQARNRIVRRYSELIQQLNLPAEKAEQLTKLLTDKRQASMDVAVTSYQHGEDPSQDMDAYHARVVASRDDIENQIHALIGDAAYSQYQDYDRSIGQLNVLSNLQLALRSTNEPLTTEQTARFKEVLQDSNSTRITSKLIRDSRDVLSPLQMQALEDLRAVQQANSQKKNQPMQVLPNLPVSPQKPKP